MAPPGLGLLVDFTLLWLAVLHPPRPGDFSGGATTSSNYARSL